MQLHRLGGEQWPLCLYYNHILRVDLAIMTQFCSKNTNLHDKTERFHNDQAIVGKFNYLDFASLCRFNNLTCQMEPNPLVFNSHPSMKEEEEEKNAQRGGRITKKQTELIFTA